MFNQDLDFETLLNEIFGSDPVSNEHKVNTFFNTIILRKGSPHLE